MKKSKRLFSLLITLVMVFSMSYAFNISAVTVHGYATVTLGTGERKKCEIICTKNSSHPTSVIECGNANCSRSAYIKAKCNKSGCGVSFKKEFGLPAPHSYTVTKKANCTENGLKKCPCGTTAVISKLGHKPASGSGSTCTRCGKKC